MQKPTRLATIAFLMTLMFSQFNNCGNYADPAAGPTGAASVACLNANCVSENADNLKVIPHLGNGEYAVPAGLSEFNMGGDCNEGGYISNLIHWELVLNGRIVRHSGMQIGQGLTAESKCINGRFLIYVTLAPLTIGNEDPYDRTGLRTETGARSAYNLNIIIYGQSAEGTAAVQQFLVTVPLNAI